MFAWGSRSYRSGGLRTAVYENTKWAIPCVAQEALSANLNAGRGPGPICPVVACVISKPLSFHFRPDPALRGRGHNLFGTKR